MTKVHPISLNQPTSLSESLFDNEQITLNTSRIGSVNAIPAHFHPNSNDFEDVVNQRNSVPVIDSDPRCSQGSNCRFRYISKLIML